MPSVVIGIAGGTGAGKTTLAKRVYAELGGSANVTYLTHDDYYRDLSHLPIEERAKTNFDHPDSLETELLVSQLGELREGRGVDVPVYDFGTHSRKGGESRRVEPNAIILVEGILIFADEALAKLMDVKVFVDADSDIRLMRRIARDTAERGRSVSEVMEQYETTVRPMHEAFVEPSKRVADVIVHSTGHGDIALQMICNHLRAEGGLPPGPGPEMKKRKGRDDDGKGEGAEEAAVPAGGKEEL